MSATPLSAIVKTLRQSFHDGVLRSVKARKEIIEQMILLIDENQDKIIEALHKDLHRPQHETFMAEITSPKVEGLGLLRNMDKWLSDESVPRTLITMMDTPYVQRQPYGVVLIMGPWNYPFWATIMPMMGAIAAGNTVLLKPSEFAVASSAVLADLIPKYVNDRVCQVYQADVDKAKDMLAKERFDYIFFTGGMTAGLSVYAAATKYLTPVTLELGGKCPAYIDSKVHLKVAAKRIMWSKIFNAGQTCVSVDYAMCHKDVVEDFKKLVCDTLVEFFGKEITKDSDFGHIVNKTHFTRLTKLLTDSKGKVIAGGQTDMDSLFIAPTVLCDITEDDSLMSEEIFGPILPIITVDSSDEALRMVKARGEPMSVYVFTDDSAVFDSFKYNTSSGAIVQNDCSMHETICELPFGGVGASGIGQYHGRYSIDTFSHHRAVLLKTTSNQVYERTLYPPYTEGKAKFGSWAMLRAGKGGCSIM